MRARRALTIAIATPLLLATVGMAGASAATLPTPQKPKPEESVTWSKPEAPSTDSQASSTHSHDKKPAGDEAKKSSDDEAEEGLLGTLTGELAERIGPGAHA
ncbi:hypothetical protein ACWC0C_00520 [Streptomyces sp. NPDC001709]